MKINTIVLSLLIVTALSAVHCAFPDYFHAQVFHTAFEFNSTSVLYYGGSEATDAGTILGCYPEPFSAGLALHPEKVSAHAGFYYEISWSQSNCNYSNATDTPLGSDGFAAVFLKDLPTNEQVNSSVGTFGVGGVHDAYIIAYSMRNNVFYFCRWNEPTVASLIPGELRNRCQVIPHDGHLTCTDWYYFDFIYYDGILSIVVDGNDPAAKSIRIGEMDPVEYYIGVGFSTDNYYNKQELIEFFYAYSVPPAVVTEFTSSSADLTTSLTYCKNGVLEAMNDTIQLVDSAAYQYATVSSKFVVNPKEFGFASKFTWTSTECDQNGIGGEGFSFFFTPYEPRCVHRYMPGDSLGITFIPNTTAFAYSNTYNMFYICSWSDPIVALTDIVANNPVCLSFPNPRPRPSCDQSHSFSLIYSLNEIIYVYMDNLPLFATQLKFTSTYHYVGFSGSNWNTNYFKQSIDYWRIQTDWSQIDLADYKPIGVNLPELISWPIFSPPTEPTTPIENSTPIDPATPINDANPPTGSNFVFLDDAHQIDNSIQITMTGGSGLVYNTQPLNDITAFMTRFTWTPTDCDPVYNGADGWTFFLTKNIPTIEQVQSSPGGGLGIQNVPNTIMAAYSATFNEFWISNWTDSIVGNFHWQVAYEPVSGPKYTCGDGSFNFIIVYDQPVLQIILDKKVVIAAEVDLDPSVPYYYGLSGGTGGGYFRQHFTNWSIARLSPLV